MVQPLIFLHGWSMRGRVFDDVIARLGPEFECYAPDLPGHGDATGDDISLDACDAQIAELVIQLERPILVGWSMGATAAWRYISRQGTDALAGLVTIDMSPRILPALNWQHGIKRQSADAVRGTTAKICADWPRAIKGITRDMYAPMSSPSMSREETLTLLRPQDSVRLGYYCTN